MNAPERILVRTDYDGTHDGTWIIAAPYEPPIEYTGSEPQYVHADLFDAQAATIKELTEALEKCTEDLSNIYHSEFDGVWGEADFENEIRPYRAALAKAKGGE